MKLFNSNEINFERIDKVSFKLIFNTSNLIANPYFISKNEIDVEILAMGPYGKYIVISPSEGKRFSYLPSKGLITKNFIPPVKDSYLGQNFFEFDGINR
jgi:hypothetical protein